MTLNQIESKSLPLRKFSTILLNYLQKILFIKKVNLCSPCSSNHHLTKKNWACIWYLFQFIKTHRKSISVKFYSLKHFRIYSVKNEAFTSQSSKRNLEIACEVFFSGTIVQSIHYQNTCLQFKSKSCFQSDGIFLFDLWMLSENLRWILI